MTPPTQSGKYARVHQRLWRRAIRSTLVVTILAAAMTSAFWVSYGAEEAVIAAFGLGLVAGMMSPIRLERRR